MARCPFYCENQNDKRRIKCEGIVPHTTTQIAFRGDKQWYMKDYCFRNFEKCRIYRMLKPKQKDDNSPKKQNGHKTATNLRLFWFER